MSSTKSLTMIVDSHADVGDPAGGALSARQRVDEVFSDELVDQLFAGGFIAQQIGGPDGLLKQLTRWLVERAMET